MSTLFTESGKAGVLAERDIPSGDLARVFQLTAVQKSDRSSGEMRF
jgi:hypothetical protein